MANDGYDYDLITIGAGSGGVRGSRWAASQYGAKVAVVELPFAFVSSETEGGAGGTCVIRGCVPKKLLMYGSAFAAEFADAKEFGWSTSDKPAFDLAKLIKNKGTEIERLNSVYGRILGNAGVDHIEGRGTIKDANTIQITAPDGSTKDLKTKNILIATGGRPSKLNIPGAEHAITSDEALMIDQVPKDSYVIYGAGYIAVEFAGIFAGFGANVHLFFRKPLPLTGFDEECRGQVAENLSLSGVHVHSECLPVRIDKNDDSTLTFVYTDKEGAEQSIKTNHVMMATGRHPAVNNLGLENVPGVKQHPKTKAILVDEYSRTDVPNIWALGDVTDRINLTPVALMEGMAFADTAFGGKPTTPDYEYVASAVFCQPPLASVGESEEGCVAKYAGALDVYVSKFRPMRNTISGRPEKTLMKMIVHKDTDKVVGVHMVGPDAAEIMQGIAVALKAGATKAIFDKTVGIHPSSAEEFVTMRSVSRTIEGKGTETP